MYVDIQQQSVCSASIDVQQTIYNPLEAFKPTFATISSGP